MQQACGRDAELRRKVEKLLAVHPEVRSFLDEPAARRDVRTAGAPVLPGGAGTSIGPYKLLQQIGEGGFGVVYMAEQLQPVRRRVALKIIKPGLDTRSVVARFEAERQALALMDHANIARVLDAGDTETGRPYFVMDLVKGVPITDLCDKNRLDPRQRLALVVKGRYRSSTTVSPGNHPIEFDLTGDTLVTPPDRDFWVTEPAGTLRETRTWMATTSSTIARCGGQTTRSQLRWVRCGRGFVWSRRDHTKIRRR